MNCTNCGKELLENAKFCAGCGQKIETMFAEQTQVSDEPIVEEAPVQPVEETVSEPLEQAAWIPGATEFGMPMQEQEAPVFEQIEQEPSVRQMPRYMTDALPNEEAAPASAVAIKIDEPEKKRKKMSLGMIIGLCAAGVALAATVTAAVIWGPSLFGKKEDPAAKGETTEKGGVKANYTGTGKLFDAGLDEDAKNMQKYSADVEVELLGGDWLSDDMTGVSYSYTQDMNKPDRKAGFWAEATRDKQSMDMQILLEDDELYIGLDELLGEGLYGVNTETLGEDLMKLSDLGIEGLEEWGNVSFNAFDLMSEAYDVSGAADKTKLPVAVLDVLAAVEKEEVGEELIEIHGVDYECVKYDGLLKEEDAETFLCTVVDSSILGLDMNGAVETFVRGIGLPADVEDEILYDLDISDGNTDEVIADIKESMNYVGDIEMDLYYSGDYLMAALFEREGVKISLYISGENYADEVSLILDDGNEVTEIHSVGNHAGVGDEWTDNTTVTYEYDGERDVVLTSEITYGYNKDKDNFSWKIEVPEEEIEIAADGTLTIGDGEIEADLKKVTVKEYGEIGLELAARVRYANYEQRVTGTKKQVPGMKMLEMYRLMDEVTGNLDAFEQKFREVLYGY